jgi:hypothetical protein
VDDLVQFLRDRLDEDEAVIQAPESWTEFDESQQGTRRVDVDHSIERVVACTRAWRGVHIARHDPTRVLREIEAKRQVVRALESAEVALRNTEPGREPHELVTGAANSLRAAVRMLAAVHADHPGYRPEWRP